MPGEGGLYEPISQEEQEKRTAQVLAKLAVTKAVKEAGGSLNEMVAAAERVKKLSQDK